MFRYATLDSVNLEQKIVGVRVDINSPVIDSKVVSNERIVEAVKTLKELVDKNSKVIVLAHQGREGRDDFLSLENHIPLLSKELKKTKIHFSKLDLKSVKTTISKMNFGEILIVENVRFIKDEIDLGKKNNVIIEIQKLFDFYVFDAFSIAHRKQASVVGCTSCPVLAGRNLEKELSNLHILEETDVPRVYVFGGAKPDDLLDLIEVSLKGDKVDSIFLTGVIGEVALHINGFYLGKKLNFLEEKGFLSSKERLAVLLKKYKDKFVLPLDVALFDSKKRIEISVNELERNKEILDKYLIGDIGSKTVDYYSLFLKHSGSIYFKGPSGDFEKKEFENGTKEILKAITSSGAFTFMGGGHSVTSAQMFGFLDKFSYVSLAGGALVHYLSGKDLPGFKILNSSYGKFECEFDDFLVVGSNTVDTCISLPEEFSKVTLGDKIKINEDFKTLVGGGGINVSICLSRLGAGIRYLGKMSEESHDIIETILRKNKVSILKSKKTKRPAAKSVLLDTKEKDRVIFTYRGQNSYLEKNDFSFQDINAKYVYFSSLSDSSFETQLEIAKHLKRNHCKSIVCYNLSSHLIRNEKRIKSLLKYVDILVLNYEEAQLLTGEKTISSCLKKIKDLVLGVVVITDGSRGAYAYDSKKEYYGPSKKPKVVDSTGAGDSFAGTFFYFFVRNYGIQKSLEYAAINAASVVSTKGANEGLLYYEDIMKNK